MALTMINCPFCQVILKKDENGPYCSCSYSDYTTDNPTKLFQSLYYYCTPKNGVLTFYRYYHNDNTLQIKTGKDVMGKWKAINIPCFSFDQFVSSDRIENLLAFI